MEGEKESSSAAAASPLLAFKYYQFQIVLPEDKAHDVVERIKDAGITEYFTRIHCVMAFVVIFRVNVAR